MSSAPRHDCESLRFALIQRAERDASSRDQDADALDAHLAGCSACRREVERAERRVLLARSLTRANAPSELDGAVVAALQAGARQERAIRALATLTPVAAPDDLARLLTAPRAPAVLDRLVGEDLVDPAKAFASRYARRLERLRAPADLEQRIGDVPRNRRARVLPIALAAAGLLLTIGALTLGYVLRGGAVDRAPVRIAPELVVERVGIRDLGRDGYQALAGFSGGLTDVGLALQEDL